ncbi:hypothetical protein BCR43DRAFT_466347 [Syncephalastrum racemosum]|uniref:HMG box domain-containing protein n=1 Tax=Syncephalastrum racemosum TaxID=13706 RepID=A0A1X2HTZ0_SYNRA|nr:hypothetical protein BCR43DRAFT_466347 [Syncephalastrum racemosum]
MVPPSFLNHREQNTENTTAPPADDPHQQVKAFLASVNLTQYYEAFISEGFDQLEAIYEVTEFDLILMNVKRGHRRLLQRAIANAKGMPQSLPLPIYAADRDYRLYHQPLFSSSPPSNQNPPSSQHGEPSSPHQTQPVNTHTTNGDADGDTVMSASTSIPRRQVQQPQPQQQQRQGRQLQQQITSIVSDDALSDSQNLDLQHVVLNTLTNTSTASALSSTEEETIVEPNDGEAGQHVMKRRYRRHAKADKNAPTRPPSAYVMFSSDIRAEVKEQNLSFSELARVTGERWKTLPNFEKERYERSAIQKKDEYAIAKAEYEQTPEYREYQRYLQEFKRKHEAAARPVGKPRRAKWDSGEGASSSGMTHVNERSENITPTPSPSSRPAFSTSYFPVVSPASPQSTATTFTPTAPTSMATITTGTTLDTHSSYPYNLLNNSPSPHNHPPPSPSSTSTPLPSVFPPQQSDDISRQVDSS